MTTINNKCMIESCGNCEFWSEHKREGSCSQNIKADNGLVKPITFDDYLCSCYSEDKAKLDFRLYINKDDKVTITGNYSKNALLRAKEFIDEEIKRMIK